MADNRKQYEVEIGGVPHTLLLTPEDAERYGDSAKQSTASNKARTASNKGA